MRKIKTMAGLLVLACALLTGCGKKEEATTTEVTTTEATTEAKTTEATTEATPIDAEEELPAIGTESADAIKVKLTNKTGKDITGVAVKNMDSEAWSDNLLADDDSFTDKEKRYLYYTPDASEENSTESEEGEILTYAGYDIQLTFADETTMTLHALSLEDIKEGEILLADDVCYVSYESVATGETLDTKDAEIAVKEQEEAEAQAAAEAAAAAAAAQQATEAPAAGGDDECLGDGLTY